MPAASSVLALVLLSVARSYEGYEVSSSAVFTSDFYRRNLAATPAELKQQCRIGSVCLTRAECNNRGNCVNGACACDAPTLYSGANCQTSSSASCVPNCASLKRAPCTSLDTSKCGACLTGYTHAAPSGTTACAMSCATTPSCADQKRAACTAPNTCGACLSAHEAVGAVCVPCSVGCAGNNRNACANATAPDVCGSCKVGFGHVTQNAQGNSACVSCPNDCSLLNRDGCSTSGVCGPCKVGFAGSSSATNNTACSACVCNSAADCGNHGTCRNGVCKCDSGFIGAFCTAAGASQSAIESSQLVKELLGPCGRALSCAACNPIKKSMGAAVNCIWCPSSLVCLDAESWETDAVANAREKGTAHKCLGSSSDASCYHLGVDSKPCIFSTNTNDCSVAGTLDPPMTLSAMAVGVAMLAMARA